MSCAVGPGRRGADTGLTVHLNDRGFLTAGFDFLHGGGLPFFLAPVRTLRIGGITHDAVVVLGVLKVGFRRHPVPGRLGVACQGQVFFIDLPGVASYPTVRPVAVEGMGPGRPATMLLAICPTARPTSIIGTLSHRPLASVWIFRRSRSTHQRRRRFREL